MRASRNAALPLLEYTQSTKYGWYNFDDAASESFKLTFKISTVEYKYEQEMHNNNLNTPFENIELQIKIPQVNRKEAFYFNIFYSICV